MATEPAKKSLKWLPYFIVLFAGLTLALYARSVLLKKGLPACPPACLFTLMLLGVGTLFIVLDFLSRCCRLISGADKHKIYLYQSLTFLPVFLLWSSIATQGSIEESIADLRFIEIPTETIYQLMVFLMAAAFALIITYKLRQEQRPVADKKTVRVAAYLLMDMVIVVLFVAFGFEIFEHYLVREIRKENRRYSINGSTQTVEMAPIPSELTCSVKNPGALVLHSGIGVSKGIVQNISRPLLYEITIHDKRSVPQKWFTATIDRGSTTGWLESSFLFDNPSRQTVQLQMKVSYARGRLLSALFAPCSYYLRLFVVPASRFNIAHRFALWIAPKAVPEIGENDQNVILIAIDTLRADHVSCYGYPRKTTPNIDALAQEGVSFRNCLSVSPWTLPSFFSIMTSTYPSVHQYGTNIRGVGSALFQVSNFWPVGTISPDYHIKMLAEILGERHYYTGAFVNNPFLSAEFEFDRGFEEFHQCGLTSREATDQILAWLDRHKKERFFLFIHFLDPHLPIEDFGVNGLPDPFGKTDTSGAQQGTDLYDRKIRFCDEQIGRLAEKLNATGLSKTTLVVVTADHGEEFFEHNGNGHGHSVYNEVLHVPLVLYLPHCQAHDKMLDGRVSTLDIAPTILETLGLPSPAYFQGKSLAPFIHGEAVPERPLFAESLVYGHEKKALLLDNYKLIYTADLNMVELYNLADDPGETHNLAGSHSEIEQRMREALGKFINQSNRGIKVTIKSGQALSREGKLSTNGTFLKVMPQSLTAPALFTTSADTKEIYFTIRGTKETDGFTFELDPSDANVRVELTSNGGPEYPVYLGSDIANPLRSPVTFNKETLRASGIPRKPRFEKEGVYIWLGENQRESKTVKLNSEAKERLESLGYVAR